MHQLPSIEPFIKRLQDLDKEISDPNFYQDQRRAASISREHIKVSECIKLYEKYQNILQSIKDNKDLIDDPSTDPELKALAEEELVDLQAQKETGYQAVLVAMIPPDASNSKNTVMEIRAGAGGDEAALFAGDLYRMYSRLAEAKGWAVETLSTSPSESGGLKEVSFIIKGEDAYKTLKHESGVHRVQRVPATEASGRIHTSTATVAVLPEAEEIDIEINPEDLEISVCRASGPGGQGVNTTDSAVQILYKPTGMIVTCADERSQQKNKIKALTVLRSRLLKEKEEEERAKYAANRKTQVGSGDRSERIRTYNFPQGRLTDHRIGLTLYSLDEIMEGELNEVITALQVEEQKLQIESMLSDQAQ